MPIEIVMPRMGLTMEEGTVATWMKREGEAVTEGETLLEIETDKTNVEIPAPASGIMGQIVAPAGQTLPVGEVIGYLLTAGEQAPTPAGAISAPTVSDGKPKASPAARHLARTLGVALDQLSGTGPGGRVVARNVAAADKAKPEPVSASPLARRVAEDLGVDLSGVAGTGPHGRVTRADVEKVAPAPEPAAPRAAEVRPVAPPIQPGAVQPLSRPQRIMAERMVQSFSTAPHFYLHVDVDARQLVALRSSLVARLEAKAGVRVTYTDFLTRFCAIALAEQPRIMAQWAGGGLFQPQNVNVGVAIDAPNGLIVPVIRDADRMGLVEIARNRLDLTERARAGKLGPQDLEAGVFTISNLGTHGIDAFDAILNPPQAAILAVGRIKERALVENGQVVPAAMMTLSLSVDHRVLDGGAGARFLARVAELIETPALAMA